MDQRDRLLRHLVDVFPPYVPEGESAPHECMECSEIRAQLDGGTWLEVPASYIEAHGDILPLLSEPARHAFLPAWLRQALLNPRGNVPSIVMVHLETQGPSKLFSPAQVEAVVLMAQAIAEGSVYGLDEIDRESLDAVQRMWQ